MHPKHPGFFSWLTCFTGLDTLPRLWRIFFAKATTVEPTAATEVALELLAVVLKRAVNLPGVRQKDRLVGCQKFWIPWFLSKKIVSCSKKMKNSRPLYLGYLKVSVIHVFVSPKSPTSPNLQMTHGLQLGALLAARWWGRPYWGWCCRSRSLAWNVRCVVRRAGEV